MKNPGSCSATCMSIILLVTFSIPVTAQTTNPRWISEMPAPERILREIKGKDAADSAERQMGAFKHLMEIIDSMAYGLEHRFMPNKATPDEIRIKDLYWKAYLIVVKQSFEDILRNAGFGNSTTRQSAIANWGETIGRNSTNI